jgi:ribonuclease HI
MLFRMVARTGQAFTFAPFQRDLGLRAVNCRAFADDTTLLAHNTLGAESMLGEVERFCDYTGMEVRPEKCEITGMSFGTQQPLDVSRVRYKGASLPALPPDKATKYLGFYISLTLDWRQEKAYVLGKTLQAVQQLRHTPYTRSQIMMLFRTCVVPIFRYSAPLVPWTWAELRRLDKIWSRAVKYSLHLPLSFDLAPILLDNAHGGLGMEPAANFMLKEIQIHVRQCLHLGGEVGTLVQDTAKEVMRSLGMRSARDVYKVGASKVVKEYLASTPVFRMHSLLQHTYWGELDWMTCDWKYGKPLASVVQSWLAFICPVPGQEELPGITGPTGTHANTIMKVLIAMHAREVFTVQDLRANHGWGLKEYVGLPRVVQQSIRPQEYDVFVQCLAGNPAVLRLTFPKTARVTTLLQDSTLVQEGGQREALPLIADKSWAEMEGLLWTAAQLGPHNPSFLGRMTCKRFRKSGVSSIFFGIVVAQTHPMEDSVLFRIVYQDGDSEDSSLEELEEACAQYTKIQDDRDEDHAEMVANLSALAEGWRDRAAVELAQQLARLRSTLTGITFAVIVPGNDQRDSGWSAFCYRYLNPQNTSESVSLRKQRLVGSRLEDDPSSQALEWPTWQPLGSIVKVEAFASGEVSAEECLRLERWYAGDGSDVKALYSHTLQPSAHRGKITSYFLTRVQGNKEVQLPSVGEGSISARHSVWSGYNLSGDVKFDWESMQARVESKHPYLRVARSGRWTFYKTEAEATKAQVCDGLLTIGQQKRVKTHYVAFGELDMRAAAGAMALAGSDQDWTALFPYVCTMQTSEKDDERPRRVPKPKHLHWLFAEHLRSAIQANQFVGSPPTVCSFGFAEVVYGTDVPPLTCEFRPGHTVVWMDGYKQDRVKLLKQLTAPNMKQFRVLLVMSYGVRHRLQQSKWLPPSRWFRLRSFPVGTPIMLSANQFDHTPKASARVLEVWANGKARSHNMELLRDFAVSEEPLLAVQEMRGGRWQHFHQGAQDYKYREFEGIVAATDGSVLNDPEEGLCMGGGIAFRAGDHGLSDEYVRVHGHVTSFVAEGAAARVLLGMVPVDRPLVILTDSANIMFAMQHCSRRERWRDFSNHADEQLLKELATLQAQRTALTVWVKVKSHVSVELNERADRLAAEAPFVEEAVSKLYTEQEDGNVIQFYKSGEPVPVRASAKELNDHFIQLRNTAVLAKPTRTVGKLTAQGVGREYLPAVLWSETGLYSVQDKMVKRMLQCITNTFPTRARLHIMRKSEDGLCKFCSEGKPDNLYHWQCECTRFHDARTKVHNDIWSEVSKAICSHLSKHTGWEFFKETPVKDIFTSMQHHPVHAQRTPDGVFLRKDVVKYFLVDFTRGYGSTREELEKQEQTKREVYEGLMTDLRVEHRVEFYPLACGYNGAIAVDTWRKLMDVLEIPARAQERVLRLAVRAICIGFSTMVDIRHGCFRASDQSGQPG